MTHNDRGHYAKKHPSNYKVKPEIVDALKKKVSDQGISCADAHKISNDLNKTPSEIGITMDILEVRITKCQMGFFGYKPEKKIVKPAASITQTLENAIQEQLEDNRISCKTAWETAEKLNMKRIEVASACEALKVKISPCQLGAF